MDSKKEKRGRPKNIKPEDLPQKYQHIYDNYDGTVDIWKYDLTKSKNGPISVEMNVPKESLKKKDETKN